MSLNDNTLLINNVTSVISRESNTISTRVFG